MAEGNQDRYYATGKRKSAIARVYMKEGTGKFMINKVEISKYLCRPVLKMIVMQPLKLVGMEKRFDFFVNADGGGLSGQAGAIRHGISRALLRFDVELRGTLKKAGFLTRDAHRVERKKYGQKGVRGRFQFSKR